MVVGAGFYMYDVVVKKFMFAISSPDEFLYHYYVTSQVNVSCEIPVFNLQLNIY